MRAREEDVRTLKDEVDRIGCTNVALTHELGQLGILTREMSEDHVRRYGQILENTLYRRFGKESAAPGGVCKCRRFSSLIDPRLALPAPSSYGIQCL